MKEKKISEKIESVKKLPQTLKAYTGYLEALLEAINSYWEDKKPHFPGGVLFLEIIVEKDADHFLEVPMIPGMDEFIKSHPLFKYNKKEGKLIKSKEPVTARENELLQDHFIHNKLERYKPAIDNFTDRSQEFNIKLKVWVDYPEGKKSLFGTKEGVDARTKLFKNNIALYEDVLVPVNKKPVPYRYREKSLNFNSDELCFTFTVEFFPRKLFLAGVL